MKLFLFLSGLILGFSAITSVIGSSSGRIVGGSDASEGSAPHQLSLYRNGTFACGASLIGPTIVLTAAHCVSGKENSPSLFTLQYGSLELGKGSTVSVQSILPHPQFAWFPIDYDVALLRLSGAIQQGTNVGVIGLASSAPPHEANVSITGFGWIDPETKLPAERLQIAERVQIMDQDVCNLLTRSGRFLCAYSPWQHVTSGDSGGPMVYNGTLVGVASFLYNDSLLISGYSNVAELKEWIEENMIVNSGLNRTNCQWRILGFFASICSLIIVSSI